MRQETGSNLTIDNKKVSIQVKLGGLSFSATEEYAAENAEVVEIVVDTPRVILAPREAVSLDTADALLQLAGKSCQNGEQSACSELQNEIVAIMAINSNALATAIKKWGSRATFLSPLLDMRHNNENCLTIDASERVCYIRHFDNGLQYAEAMEYTSAEDILYYTSVRADVNNNIPIYIKGCPKAAKLLRKYYKRVICE